MLVKYLPEGFLVLTTIFFLYMPELGVLMVFIFGAGESSSNRYMHMTEFSCSPETFFFLLMSQMLCNAEDV